MIEAATILVAIAASVAAAAAMVVAARHAAYLLAARHRARSQTLPTPGRERLGITPRKRGPRRSHGRTS